MAHPLNWSTWSGDDPIPDGVHLGLKDDAYFDQQALGSTDLIRLFQKREGWWWSSRWNARYKRPANKALNMGRALHAIILEGVEAYEARFAAEPDYAAIPDLFDTIQEVKDWLRREQEIALTGVSAMKKDDWIDYFERAFPLAPFKSLIERRFQASIGDRATVTADEDIALRLMREVMLDESRPDNADIRKIFGEQPEDTPPLVEVSVFHTFPDGVRRRWRIDRLFPQFSLDLKSLSGWGGRPLEWAVGDIIAERGYDIQRGDYDDGRHLAYTYILEDRIFGGSFEERNFLRELPRIAPAWDWVWLFYQKPDAERGNAPVVFPVWDNAESVVHKAGKAKTRKAMQFFRHMLATQGLERPWARVAETHYTDEDYAPRIFLPHWLESPDAPSEEEPEESAHG